MGPHNDLWRPREGTRRRTGSRARCRPGYGDESGGADHSLPQGPGGRWEGRRIFRARWLGGQDPYARAGGRSLRAGATGTAVFRVLRAARPPATAEAGSSSNPARALSARPSSCRRCRRTGAAGIRSMPARNSRCCFTATGSWPVGSRTRPNGPRSWLPSPASASRRCALDTGLEKSMPRFGFGLCLARSDEPSFRLGPLVNGAGSADSPKVVGYGRDIPLRLRRAVAPPPGTVIVASPELAQISETATTDKPLTGRNNF